MYLKNTGFDDRYEGNINYYQFRDCGQCQTGNNTLETIK